MRPETPLPVHPDTAVLELPNGLTCWVRPNARPPGAVAMGLRVGVGSIDEQQAERGLSHILEHLAFAGGAHFPAGALQRFFDRQGIRLGKDCNAFTGLESTGYFLSLAAGGERAVDRCLACLADFAFGMSLQPEAVDVERQVILEEMRQHHEARARTRQRILSLLLPGSRVAERHPLGTEEVVRSVTAEGLRSYYRRWYRPESSIVLVAGEVDPAKIERLLHRRFQAWPSVPEALRPPARDRLGRPAGESRPRAAVLADPEIEQAELRLVDLQPAHGQPTAGALRRRLIDEIGLWLVNQRLDARARCGKAPFRHALLSVSPLVRELDLVQALAAGSPDRTPEMLEALVREIRRARLHGFSEAELERARDHLLAGARRGLRLETAATATAVVMEMNDAAATGRPPMSEAQKLDLLTALLPGVTAEELRAAFAARLDPSHRLTLAVMPEKVGFQLPAEDELLALHRQAAARPVGPPPERVMRRRLMAGAPRPGTVTDHSRDADLGVQSMTFDNGTRVHLRPMDRENQVAVDLTLAGGRICERAESFGITGAAALPFSQPATGALSSTQIRDLMADESVRLRGWVEEDAIMLRLSGEPRGLERGLRLVHLLLTEPRLEAAAFERWQSQATERREPTLEAALSLETLRLLTGDDPRFRLLTHDRARAIDLEQARRWLRSLIAVPIEAAIAGDLDGDRALDLALRYLGSLPTRPTREPGLDRLRQLAPKRGPLESRRSAKTATPRAAVLCGWRAAPWPAVDDRRLLRMATQILNQRLHQEVRKGRGLTYDADSSFSPSKAYPRASLFSVAFYTAPERVTEAAALIRQLVEGLAANGPTAAEMQTVARKFHQLATRAERDPRYWSRALADLDYRRLELDQLKRVPERFLAFSREDLRAALARYVTEDRRLGVICLPAVDP